MVNTHRLKVMKDVAVQYDARAPESTQTRDESLDRQLVNAEALVFRLRQMKNERALISRLPVEILIQIFSYYPASDRNPHIRFRPPPPWLAVTHVCQRWRNAALSCPSLWVDIISTNFRWTEVMLERSRDVPIQITVDDGGSEHMPCEVRTARLLFSKIYRAQSLAVTCVHAIIACIPMLFDAEGAPLLQELIITNFHPSTSIDLVSQPLFSGKTPSLQLLSLHRCRVLWSSPLFRSDLVYLYISHIPPHHRPHPGQVLEVLKGFTRLECLQLEEALPIHLYTTNESPLSFFAVGERFHLSRLRFFSLCSRSALDILDFAARVIVPASSLFQLICEEFEQYSPTVDSGDVMIAALASHLCAPRDDATATATTTNSTGGASDSGRSGISSADTWGAVRRLHVRDIPNARSWSLFAGTGGPADDDGRGAPAPPSPAEEQTHILSLHMRWNTHPGGARAAAKFIERALRLPPLVRARTLLVESTLFESGSAWRTAFSRLLHVRGIYAGGAKTAVGVAQMLCEVGQQPVELGTTTVGDADVYAAISRVLPSSLAFEHPAGPSPPVLFPMLRSLAIANADFVDGEGELFGRLYLGLAARRKSESGGLANLAVWRCDVRQVQLHALGRS
ncbi:hypothetical protein BGW80DRAFT_800651 [Lactifluus volemus]|nr:hypothetical protein BGW80DRAFT_800651 [Lactifluus volemus]